MTKFFTVQAVADELGVDVESVRRWIRSGKLRVDHKKGKVQMISDLALATFCEESGRYKAPEISVGSMVREEVKKLMRYHKDEYNRLKKQLEDMA